MSIIDVLTDEFNKEFKVEDEMRAETVKAISQLEEKANELKSYINNILSRDDVSQSIIEKVQPEIKVVSDWIEANLEVLQIQLASLPEDSAQVPEAIIADINRINETMEEIRAFLKGYQAKAEERGRNVEFIEYRG